MERRHFIRTGGVAAAALLASRPSFAAPTAERLRVIQIGTAHSHAPEKWQTLQRLPEVFEVAGIWEPDQRRRSKAAKEPEYRGARWLTETETFGDHSIRGAVVEVELPDMLATGRRCIEAGWHVHLDKPAAADLAAFSALQRMAAHRGLVLQLGYMLRYDPAIRFCFQAQRQGWLGEIFALSGDMGKVIGPARRPWLAENYGGSMMLLGCHLVDLAIGLLGRPERYSSHRRQTYPQQDRFFDHEIAVLEYPRGLATVRSMLAEVGGEERRQWVMCGTRGTVEVMPLEAGRVRLCLKEPADRYKAGWQEVMLAQSAGRYDEMLKDFAGMAAGRESIVPVFTPDHDRLVLETLLATAALPGPARVNS